MLTVFYYSPFRKMAYFRIPIGIKKRTLMSVRPKSSYL